MEQHPKQLFSATVVFFEGAENDYEVTISARKITSNDDVFAKSSTVTKGSILKNVGSSPIVYPKKYKKRANIQPKNNVLTSSGRNDRSCNGGCRCVSFYGLRESVTENDIVRLCSDFGLVAESVRSMWDHPDKKSLFVWMVTQKQANDIVKEYDGRELDGKTLRVIKGHFPKSRITQSGFGQHKKGRVNFVSQLNKELYPKRKEVSDKFSKERAEELDREIDEYMREKSDGKLDNDIDEYMREKSGGKLDNDIDEYMREKSGGKLDNDIDEPPKRKYPPPKQKMSNMFSEKRLDILKRDERKNREADRGLLCSSNGPEESEDET
jgi:hypothetical protein